MVPVSDAAAARLKTSKKHWKLASYADSNDNAFAQKLRGVDYVALNDAHYKKIQSSKILLWGRNLSLIEENYDQESDDGKTISSAFFIAFSSFF